jgi:hypothetical protein
MTSIREPSLKTVMNDGANSLLADEGKEQSNATINKKYVFIKNPFIDGN